MITDFKVGDIVIYHNMKYDPVYRNYKQFDQMAIVTRIEDVGIAIETEKGQHPRQNIRIGKYCVGTALTKLDLSNSPNVVLFRRKA